MIRLGAYWRGLTLRGQLVWILVLAAVLIELGTMTIEYATLQRRTDLQQHSTAHDFAHAAFSLLQATDRHDRPALALQLSGPNRSVTIGPAPDAIDPAVQHHADTMADRLRADGFDFVEVIVAETPILPETQADPDTVSDLALVIDVHMRAVQDVDFIIATARILPPPARRPMLATLAVGTVVTLIFLAIMLIVLRQMTIPLTRLAQSADQISHGEAPPPIPLSGASDIRKVTGTFNRMGETVAQTIAYQKGLLQSLGHDLKSPLRDARSALGEVQDADQVRAVSDRLDRIESTLASITALTRATLRDGDVEQLDLGSLLDTLIEEADMRGDRVEEGTIAPRIIAPARFHALGRALRNLIENAVRYGGNARISLETDAGFAVITIDDDGPGIDPEKLETVTRPFVRLSDDPRGTGLGLSIASTIVHDHGGALTLENRPQGGIRQTVRLPL